MLVQRAGVLLAPAEHGDLADAREVRRRRGCRSRRRRLRRRARQRPPSALRLRERRARADRPARASRASSGVGEDLQVVEAVPAQRLEDRARSRRRRRPAARGRSCCGSARASRRGGRRGSGRGARSICSGGSRQRCHESYSRPTSAPLSSISSAASASELATVQYWANSRWTGSSATGTPCARPSSAIARMPSRIVSRSSPGPVRKRTHSGSKGARRRMRRADRLDALAGVGRSSISGSGRIDGTAGTAAAAPSPLARKRSSESSPSFISQIPIPSAPAARYASRSSANDWPTVVICEIESLTATCSSPAQQAASRRACPSPRRAPARDACSRRCARAGRPASRDPGSPGAGARGSSGRARASPSTGRPGARLTFAAWRSAGESATRLQDRRLEVRHVPRDPRLDAVGVALAQLLRPRAVAGGRARRRRRPSRARAAPAAGSRGARRRRARATGRSSAAGRRRPSPRPAAGRARPR